MNIPVITSVGYGPTELSAFDNALHLAGISNFNLVPLSSVIPPGTTVEENAPFELPEGEQFGNRLYCVMARNSTSVEGETVWAGIGWVQAEDKRGLFVEHHAHSEADLNYLIDKSLSSMVTYRDVEFGPINRAVCGGTSTKQAVCALVIAPYQAQSW